VIRIDEDDLGCGGGNVQYFLCDQPFAPTFLDFFGGVLID
jgi:hypothetical protein